MSKESTERGLVLTTTRAKYERVSKRAEEDTRRGRFVPEARDNSRLLARFVGAPRR